jgi:hypothetical protein
VTEKGKPKVISTKKIAGFLMILGLSLLLQSQTAIAETSTTMAEASQLYSFLTGGIPLASTNPLQSQIVADIAANNWQGAADAIVAGDSNFYETLLVQVFAGLNKSENYSGGLNDRVAIMQGILRDEGTTRNGSVVTYKNFMTEDVVYYDPTVTGGNAFSFSNQNHFAFLAGRQGGYIKNLVATKREAATSAATTSNQLYPGVGIFDSQDFGSNYFSAGTDRRTMDMGVVQDLMCTLLANAEMFNLPDWYRVDFPYEVSGSSAPIENNCAGCHRFNDPISGVWLDRDYRAVTGGSAMVQVPTTDPRFDKENAQPEPRAGKLNARTSTFWMLNVEPAMNDTVFGFQGLSSMGGYLTTSGNNLAEFAPYVANATGVANCMVKRFVSHMYLKKELSPLNVTTADTAALATQSGAIQTFVNFLQNSGSLRQTIEQIAIYYTQNH